MARRLAEEALDTGWYIGYRLPVAAVGLLPVFTTPLTEILGLAQL